MEELIFFAAYTAVETHDVFQWAGQPPQLPLHVGDLRYMVPWTHPSLPSTHHLDRFSLFRRNHKCDQQTDIQTDHTTPFVAIYRHLFTVIKCII